MGTIGRFRRVIAGLLVLAILALSAVPALAAPTHPAQGSHHHTTEGCLPLEESSSPAAAPIQPDQGRPGGDHHGTTPSLACCLAVQCPMLFGGLPGAPSQPLPHAALLVRDAALVRQSVGIDIAPALPPPRGAA
jgi:hypothetical protein